MKKLFLFALAFAIAAVTFGAPTAVINPTKPVRPNAASIMIPLGDGQSISLLDLSEMRIKDVEKITGKKMKLADRVSFKIAQKQLRNSINPDGTLNDKRIIKAAKKAVDGSGFHLGGFALGFLLGLIGVLIAYLIKDDLKSSRVKWAWLGLAAWLAILLVVLVL